MAKLIDLILIILLLFFSLLNMMLNMYVSLPCCCSCTFSHLLVKIVFLSFHMYSSNQGNKLMSNDIYGNEILSCLVLKIYVLKTSILLVLQLSKKQLVHSAIMWSCLYILPSFPLCSLWFILFPMAFG